MNMLQLFKVGDQIYGFCNGYFGRDDYEDKTCVMVTPHYAVFQYESGRSSVLNYTSSINKHTVDSWKNPDTDMKTIEVWEEGFCATGQAGTANLLGTYKAIDFDDTVKQYYKTFTQKDSYPLKCTDDGVYSIWACRLFDNETDARKSFG